MFTCERCNHSFKAKQSLTRHMNRKRPCVAYPKPVVTEDANITVNIKGITLDDLKLLLGDKIVVMEVNNTSVPPTPPQTPTLEATVASLVKRIEKLEEKRTVDLPVVEPIYDAVASTEPSDNETSIPEQKKNIKKKNIKKDKQNAKEKVEEIKELSIDDLVKKCHDINNEINDNKDIIESIVVSKDRETKETKQLQNENKKLNLYLFKVKKELHNKGFRLSNLKLNKRD
jgi:hypothetical protein